MNFFAIIGRVVLALFAEIGRLSLFTWGAISHIFRPPFFWRLLFQQMMRIGYFSLPVVALTAFFTGGALALLTSSAIGVMVSHLCIYLIHRHEHHGEMQG